MKFTGVQARVDFVNYLCKLYACISTCMLCRHIHMHVLCISVCVNNNIATSREERASLRVSLWMTSWAWRPAHLGRFTAGKWGLQASSTEANAPRARPQGGSWCQGHREPWPQRAGAAELWPRQPQRSRGEQPQAQADPRELGEERKSIVNRLEGVKPLEAPSLVTLQICLLGARGRQTHGFLSDLSTRNGCVVFLKPAMQHSANSGHEETEGLSEVPPGINWAQYILFSKWLWVNQWVKKWMKGREGRERVNWVGNRKHPGLLTVYSLFQRLLFGTREG